MEERLAKIEKRLFELGQRLEKLEERVSKVARASFLDSQTVAELKKETNSLKRNGIINF